MCHNEYMELSALKGLGQKRIELLNERGIFSAEDLAMVFPKTYFDLDTKDYFEEDGKYKLIKCEVLGEAKICRIRKNFTYTYALCRDNRNRVFRAIWYNQPYIKSAIKDADVLFLYGKNSNTKHGYFVVSAYRNQAKIREGTKLLPVYKTFKTLGQSVMLNAISEALEKCQIESIIPKEFEKNNLFNLNDAVKTIHDPQNLEELSQAKKRIDIEKVLPLIELNFELKTQRNGKKRQKYVNFSHILDKFCSFLPYNLTEHQLKVLDEIKADLMSPSAMNRMVQGDVGSGKTIVALISAAVCLASGYNVIFIAPTEILAAQHYAEAKKYFNMLGYNTRFLTSSTKPLSRREIISSMAQEPTLLIGTHSCLNDQIPLDNVAMLIIDEQHRFGVKQRATIVNKASSCELLMLSATPIPRSLALTYYGGLDISILAQPPFKKQIQTNLVSASKEEDMWNFVESKISSGSKVYVVCANIDEDDDDSLQPYSVTAMYKFLCSRFGKDRVLMAHGRLSSQEENKTLGEFKDGKASILVSTTIVEVGVDIASADIIILPSPERFGLATLHQLRGRVGRAGQQAYCFCMTRGLTNSSKERIKYFKEHDNGFDIAEYDYNSRGAGNILGVEQHGRVDDIFDLISIDSLKAANIVFEKLHKEYNDCSFMLEGSNASELKDIALN